MKLQNELQHLCDKHGLTVEFSKDNTCITIAGTHRGQEYKHCLPAFRSEQGNLLHAIANIRSTWHDWECIQLMHHGARLGQMTECGWVSIPNYVGLVMVYDYKGGNRITYTWFKDGTRRWQRIKQI